MKTYLCGPIHMVSDEQTKDWRKYAEAKLTCYTINPLVRHFKPPFNDFQVIKDIIEQDLIDISRSDVVLWNYDDAPMVGSSMEVRQAYQWGKLIITVTNGLSVGPWVKYHTQFLFDTLPDACDFINKLDSDGF